MVLDNLSSRKNYQNVQICHYLWSCFQLIDAVLHHWKEMKQVDLRLAGAATHAYTVTLTGTFPYTVYVRNSCHSQCFTVCLFTSSSHHIIHCLSVSNLLHSHHTQAYQVQYHSPYQVSVKEKNRKLKVVKRLEVAAHCHYVLLRLWALGTSSCTDCYCCASVAGPNHRLV